LLDARGPVAPSWLTDRLRADGSLERGSVASVGARRGGAFNSSLWYLDVDYTPNAIGAVPRKLVLKLALDADLAIRAGRREVEFYRQARSERLAMVPRCYGASLLNGEGGSFLLLEDLSDSHAAPVTREQIIAGDGVPAEPALEPATSPTCSPRSGTETSVSVAGSNRARYEPITRPFSSTVSGGTSGRTSWPTPG
jgi:hypothetical protein